jgi:hypothetical protein
MIGFIGDWLIGVVQLFRLRSITAPHQSTNELIIQSTNQPITQQPISLYLTDIILQADAQHPFA